MLSWLFRPRTKVYVSDGKRQWWTSTVKYDPWGDPHVWDGDLLMPFRCHIRSDGVVLYVGSWKHKSGPPVDFTRKYSKRPPIEKVAP